jgi:hypothetical protein
VAFLFAILVFGGYLVPLPAAGMAWREWIVSRKTRIKTWRKSATLAALAFTTAAIPLWAYAVVRESRNDYSYVFASARFGRWSSLLLIAISAFASGKVRGYLLLASIGILSLFACSIGELP